MPISGDSGDASQSVNPYAASETEKPRSVAAGAGESLPRHYQARMDWSDRCAFLRSVGPMRVMGLVSGLTSMITIVPLVGRWLPAIATGRILDERNIPNFVFALIMLLGAALLVYASWLQWKCADAVQQVAGGRTDKLHDWSHLHFRVAWFSAVGLVVEFASGFIYALMRSTGVL